MVTVAIVRLAAAENRIKESTAAAAALLLMLMLLLRRGDMGLGGLGACGHLGGVRVRVVGARGKGGGGGTDLVLETRDQRVGRGVPGARMSEKADRKR